MIYDLNFSNRFVSLLGSHCTALYSVFEILQQICFFITTVTLSSNTLSVKKFSLKKSRTLSCQAKKWATVKVGHFKKFIHFRPTFIVENLPLYDPLRHVLTLLASESPFFLIHRKRKIFSVIFLQLVNTEKHKNFSINTDSEILVKILVGRIKVDFNFGQF